MEPTEPNESPVKMGFRDGFSGGEDFKCLLVFFFFFCHLCDILDFAFIFLLHVVEYLCISYFSWPRKGRWLARGLSFLGG